MSEQTKDALERALAAHVTDENDGAFPLHWVLAVGAVSAESADVSNVHVETPDGQANYVTMGLLAAVQKTHEAWLLKVLMEDTDD